MSLFIPAYLIMVMGGARAVKGVLPAVIVCGVAFAGVQFLVSNLLGPQLTDLLSSLAAMASLVLLLKLWKPKDTFTLAGEHEAVTHVQHLGKQVFIAWLPYLLLVVLMLIWGLDAVKEPLARLDVKFPWPGLHNSVQRIPPVVPASSNYAAVYNLNYLATSGTACMFATLLAAIFLRATPGQCSRVTTTSIRQLALPVLTIVCMLAFAFLMNYCGATTTLGLAFASTGRSFPFFGTLLGWLGVYLVGSDTSSNALFGNLQVVTAGRLGLNPLLMAAANSTGGVMGKMISLSSIAVAAAATGMPASDEAKLFHFTLKHSVILATVTALLVALYAWLD